MQNVYRPYIAVGIVIALACSCISLYVFLIVKGLRAPDEPLNTVVVNDMQYVLTCKSSLDGTSFFLYECPDEAQEVCTVLRSVDALGYNCDDDYVLQIEDDTIVATSQNGTYIVLLYQP